MTVLVGVLCEDGVVVGADSSATFGNAQLRTVEQPATKVFILGGQVIMAGTGHVGLCQRFENVLKMSLLGHKTDKCDPFTTSKLFARNAIDDFAATHVQPGQFGALVAFPSASGFHLCEFDVRTFQPEFKTHEMWFVSMGSGQPITDPLLGMLRRVLFNNVRPKLPEGLFAVTWALQHAIELNPGGINGPLQVAELRVEKGTKRMVARMLGDDELVEHVGHVQGIERHIAKFRDAMMGGAAGPQSEIPEVSKEPVDKAAPAGS